MSHDLMTKCEQKKLYVIDGNRVWTWIAVSVSDLPSGGNIDIRCMHCHGEVRVHKQQVEHGPTDHVEHRSRQDSENCKGGSYFKGNHKISSEPIQYLISNKQGLQFLGSKCCWQDSVKHVKITDTKLKGGLSWKCLQYRF